MISALRRFPPVLVIIRALLMGLVVIGSTGVARAEVTAFKQAVAEAAAKDRAVAAFYKARDFEPIWTGRGDRARRSAFLRALEDASAHGLPVQRYDAAELRARFKAAKTPRARGQVEAIASRMFVQYAQDLQSGILSPGRVVGDIKRKAPRRDRTELLRVFAESNPKKFLRALAPRSPEYTRLLAAKLRMETQLAKGGWGAKVPVSVLKPGQSGPAVVTLRNRMVAMGYMKRSASQSYDAKLQKAVQQFQNDHGLVADGVAGKGTMAEINRSMESRLQQILVSMERERWMNRERGARHVLVNITDFHAKIIEDGKVAFATRSVVGKNVEDRRTPEFSDVMEHMVINPTWNVPRSIATKEYLPLLQRNPNAVGHLKLVDARGRTVNRNAVDFTQLTEKTFPFNMKEPPGRGNALGLVKFMFPNPYNIYLHDTPAKSLFGREYRAYSHGCIRLKDPFDFAYALLSKQEAKPKSFFQKVLKTGRETTVKLKEPLPVHIIYRTAITKPKGGMEYRRDVYGRDKRIFRALEKAGVSLQPVRG